MPSSRGHYFPSSPPPPLSSPSSFRRRPRRRRRHPHPAAAAAAGTGAGAGRRCSVSVHLAAAQYESPHHITGSPPSRRRAAAPLWPPYCAASAAAAAAAAAIVTAVSGRLLGWTQGARRLLLSLRCPYASPRRRCRLLPPSAAAGLSCDIEIAWDAVPLIARGHSARLSSSS